MADIRLQSDLTSESIMSDHNNTEPPAYDDINTSAIILTGVISAVVTLMTIYFVQGVAYRWQNSVLDQKNQAGPTSELSYQQVQEQKALLAGGGETTSIDEAMKAVVDKYGK